jgi:hypothetical protein
MGDPARRRKTPPFVMFYHRWIDTDAWRALSGMEAKLLLYLLRCYNGDNNGDLFLSERDAAKAIGCARNTASKAFVGLEQRGFIATTTKGYFSSIRKATTWRLTCWPAHGAAATHEYRIWKPTK